MAKKKHETKTLSYSDIGKKYAEDVVSGCIVASRLTQLACARSLEMFNVAGSMGWRFDDAAANRVCRFIELLPHIKGRWKSKSLSLEPWQCWVLTTVFGWLTRDGMRVIRTVYIEVPRKNAKSTLSAGVALYMLSADGEDGAEVYSAATTRDQAKITWDVARDMVLRTEGLRSRFGVTALAHSVNVPHTSSKFQSLSAEGGTLDGLNVHCGIIDELHAHKYRDVYDVLETATGSRRQPLLWAITTAGSNQVGICYEQRSYVTKILSGDATDWTYFGAIYTIDDGDDWTSEESWKKANPNYGVSVLPDDMTRLCVKAQQMPAAQANFLTKRLNVWVGADTAWLDMSKYDACADPSLDHIDFSGIEACIGVDLASKTDFASTVTAAFDKAGNICLFDRHYLPSATVESTDHAPYQSWADAGLVTETVGPITDIGQIEDDLVEASKHFSVKEIAYDPFQATQMAVRLSNEGLPMVEFRQTVLNFSEAMKEIQSRILTGSLRHNGNPVLRWMFSNVVASLDKKDNIYPRKERHENKIDGVVASIMAVARLMHHADTIKKVSIYETHGLREI